MTNRKSHMGFQLVLKSVISNDFEQALIFTIEHPLLFSLPKLRWQCTGIIFRPNRYSELIYLLSGPAFLNSLLCWIKVISTLTVHVIDAHAFNLQHFEMPFAPYDWPMLDARALSFSAVAELLVILELRMSHECTDRESDRAECIIPLCRKTVMQKGSATHAWSRPGLPQRL